MRKEGKLKFIQPDESVTDKLTVNRYEKKDLCVDKEISPAEVLPQQD